MVYMYHSFLIHSSADGHLDCFHVLAMINSAAAVSFQCMTKFTTNKKKIKKNKKYKKTKHQVTILPCSRFWRS